MGRTWIGFQPATKPVPGHTWHEKASFPAEISAPAVVALITTRDGLGQWLAPVTQFSQKRGGNIDFLAEDGPFTGSFTRLDVPHAVVLMTDRHGEIALSLDGRGARTIVNVHITRFIADTEDDASVVGLLRTTISALQTRCADGR